MYRDGEALDNVHSWEDAIDMFFNWLRCEYPNGAILVAHAAFNTDARLIIRDFQECGWANDQIKETVVGFCDTLVAFPKYFPKCQNQGKYFSLVYILLQPFEMSQPVTYTEEGVLRGLNTPSFSVLYK